VLDTAVECCSQAVRRRSSFVRRLPFRSTFNNQCARGVRRTAAHLRSDALYATTHALCAAVLYTSDLTAYSNLYLVGIGMFDQLPDLE
jgi:hypothetical protein